MADRQISVTILGDAASVERAFSSGSKSANKFGKEVDTAGKGALAASLNFKGLGRSVAFASAEFVGAAGFVEVTKKAIEQASSLEEQLARTTDVFGESADGIKAWSKDSAEAMGLSQSAALDAANTIGTLLKNVGQTPAKAAEMSKQLVQTAADMAAFKGMGTTTTDVVKAIDAALAGNTRSLKQYGVIIDATKLKNAAYSDGIAQATVSTEKVKLAQDAAAIAQAKLTAAEAKYASNSTQVRAARDSLARAEQAVQKAQAGSVNQLTAEQKALSAVKLITEQTASQQGAFKEKSHELAIEEQILHGQLQNIEADLGTALLPTVKEYMGQLEVWIKKEQQSGAIQRDVQQSVKDLTAAIQVGGDVVKVAEGLFHGLSDAVGGDENAIKALVAAFVLFKSAGIASVIGAMVGKIAGIGTTAATAEEEVSGLRLALMSLGGPEVLAALAAGYGAYELFKNATQKTTVAPSSYGPQIEAGESITNMQNDLRYLKSIGDNSSQLYDQLTELEKAMMKAGSIVATAGQVAAAAKKAALDAAETNAGADPTGKYGAAFTQATGVQFTGVSTAGENPTLLSRVAGAAKAAGATQIMVTSAKRSPGPGNDVSDSNHITGNALDGYAIINGKKVPLGQAILPYAAAYGLRSGDVAGFDPKTAGGYDPVHVDDGANVNGGTPISDLYVASGCSPRCRRIELSSCDLITIKRYTREVEL